MKAVGRFPVLILAALVLASSLRARPAASEEANAAADGPGRGELAGFVVTPQTGGGNSAFLLAPNSAWFLATSPQASVVRLIDINTGITLRYLIGPGLRIAALSISPDSNTVFARDDDGHVVAWDAATGRSVTTAAPVDFHDITRLSLIRGGKNDGTPAAAEFAAQYHLQSHLGDLKKYAVIRLSPTQEYAMIGYIGDPRWNAFQIWNLKKEQTELFFRLEEDTCGFPPFSFDYDGKHLIFGNTAGESFSNHLDFTAFQVNGSGPEFAPGSAYVSRIRADKCRYPADFDFGFQQNFNISPGGQLLTKGEGMPGTQEWAAWDLRNGRKVASIDSDGYGIVSSDGSTFVVLHNRESLGAPSNRLTVQRHGKRKTFRIPTGLQSDGLLVVVSSNGRWIALQLAETVVVWSATDGGVVKQYQIGRPAIMLRVSDQGDPLLVDGKNGAAFVNGRWRTVRTAEHGLIVPLTPNFHAQCGAIFCDRVVTELGVVERQPRDERAGNAARVDLSPDGRFMIVGTRDKDDNISHDVIDIADGHLVLHDRTGNFTSDGRSLVVRENDENGEESFVKYDLPTGKRAWTVTPNRAEDGFYMIFPDGRVRYSKARSLDFELVRGFEVRPLDAAAVKQFVAPPDR